MRCESCQRLMYPLVRVIFNDGEEFIVCAGCADQVEKGGVLEALNRIRYRNAGSLATT